MYDDQVMQRDVLEQSIDILVTSMKQINDTLANTINSILHHCQP
jgi:hypothetical protein